jgi:hypothetical protein
MVLYQSADEYFLLVKEVSTKHANTMTYSRTIPFCVADDAVWIQIRGWECRISSAARDPAPILAADEVRPLGPADWKR